MKASISQRKLVKMSFEVEVIFSNTDLVASDSISAGEYVAFL